MVFEFTHNLKSWPECDQKIGSGKYKLKVYNMKDFARDDIFGIQFDIQNRNGILRHKGEVIISDKYTLWLNIFYNNMINSTGDKLHQIMR